MENVLYICYNRLDYAVNSYTELLKFSNNITVVVDLDESGNTAVLDFIKNLGGYKKLIVRKKNFGCERNIILSIIECFKKSNDLIIVEDDVIVSQEFFDCIADNKQKVISEEFAIIGRSSEHGNSFSWGWYITKPNWEKYFYIDNVFKSWEMFEKIFYMSEAVKPFFKAQFADQKRFTWDQQLLFNILSNESKILYYPQRFTQNIGIQSSNQLRFEYINQNEVVDTKDGSLLTLS